MQVNVGGSRLLREILEAGISSIDRQPFYLGEVASCIERNRLNDRGILARLGGVEESELLTFFRGLSDGHGADGKQAFIDGWLARNPGA
jgi:hypothetical protein